MFQRCSPLTTLCLDFPEKNFGFIISPPLIFIRYYLINCCNVHCLCSGGILKTLSMQVLCFCRLSYKKSDFVRNQMYPVKPWSVITVSALHHRWVINLSFCLMMFSHKCHQIFCAILFCGTFCLPPPILLITLSSFCFSFPSSSVSSILFLYVIKMLRFNLSQKGFLTLSMCTRR